MNNDVSVFVNRAPELRRVGSVCAQISFLHGIGAAHQAEPLEDESLAQACSLQHILIERSSNWSKRSQKEPPVELWRQAQLGGCLKLRGARANRNDDDDARPAERQDEQGHSFDTGKRGEV